MINYLINYLDNLIIVILLYMYKYSIYIYMIFTYISYKYVSNLEKNKLLRINLL